MIKAQMDSHAVTLVVALLFGLALLIIVLSFIAPTTSITKAASIITDWFKFHTP